MNVYLASLARHLADRNLAVEVFTRSSGADLPASVRVEDGITVHHIPAGPPTATKAQLASHLCAFYLAMASHPMAAELDVLHAHYWMSGWVGRHLRRHSRVALVQTFHTLGRVKNELLAPGDTPEPAVRLAAEARIVTDADAVIAPTLSEADLLLSEYSADPARVHVVPAGVDLRTFNTAGDRTLARQQLGGGRIVLFVGRLQALKAPDTAVRALAALDRVLPDDGVPTRLVIVGGASGPPTGDSHPDALLKLAADLGVVDRVAILAPRRQEELAALYRAADAVIVPSHSESFGLVALEAQACGTPVVASDVGGLRSLVRGGGSLVSSRDPEDFATALAPYLVAPAVRAAASEAAERTAQDYSWSVTTEATLAVYRDVLARREPEMAYEAERRGA